MDTCETDRNKTEGPVLRRAAEEDIPAIKRILRMAVERMLAEGKQQWDETYPNEIHVRDDIDNGVGYVFEKEGEVVGYAAVVFTGEPSYGTIDGKWLSEEPYVVVHRLAVSQAVRGTGTGHRFMAAIEEYARSRGAGSFRIDTNFDNYAMLGLLERMGFTYCGEIEYEGDSRKAFEKLI